MKHQKFVMLSLAGFFCATNAHGATPSNFYGNWYLSCDNVKTCTAMSLPIGENVPDNATTMTITRDAGLDDNLKFVIDFPKDKKLNRMTGDDDQIIYLNKSRGAEGEIIITDRMAYGDLYKLFKNWSMMRLYAAGQKDGKPEAVVPLDGIMAALLAMDAAQNRVGTVTALVKSGIKSADTLAPRLPLPVVSRYRGPRTAPADAAFVKKMERHLRKASRDCSDASANKAVTAHALDTMTTLVIQGCGGGAYNSNDLVFTVRGGDPATTRPLTSLKALDDIGNMLMNASFDQATLTLSHYYKGRGIGDCGGRSSWTYTGKKFDLVEQASMDDCRGRTDWPVTYRADVR
jgi:hypothetical protein